MTKVSIIIPAYKPDHLLDALASVFAQTYTDYEIIVVNDGSPFDIRKLLEPFIDRIHYVHQENKGTAGARNRGLAEARAEFIAFLDDDDYWPKEKLQWQVTYLDDHPDVGVVGGDILLIGDATHLQDYVVTKRGPITFDDLFRGSPIWSPGQTLIRKSLLTSRNGFDETIWGADDFDLWLDLARSTSIVMVPTLALYYRTHASNASRNALPMCLGVQRVLDRHLPFVSPQQRGELRLASTREMYNYRGKDLIHEWKGRLLKGEWHDSFKYILAITWFLRGARFDWTFLTSICMEMIPGRMLERKAARNLPLPTDGNLKA